MKTKTKTQTGGLTLTEQQIADFTELAKLQKAGSENNKDRKQLTDAYKSFAIKNHDALAAEGGVRAGNLKVWIEVSRTLRAEIVD